MENKNNNFEEDLFREVGSSEYNNDYEENLFQSVGSDEYSDSYIGENAKNTEVVQSGIKIGKKVKIFFSLCAVVIVAIILNNVLDFSLTRLFTDKMEIDSFDGNEIENDYVYRYEENNLEHKKYIKIKSCEDGKVIGKYIYIVGANFDYDQYEYEIQGNISEHKKNKLTIQFTVTKKDSKDETLCPETFTVEITDDYSTLKLGDSILEKE